MARQPGPVRLPPAEDRAARQLGSQPVVQRVQPPSGTAVPHRYRIGQRVHRILQTPPRERERALVSSPPTAVRRARVPRLLDEYAGDHTEQAAHRPAGSRSTSGTAARTGQREHTASAASAGRPPRRAAPWSAQPPCRTARARRRAHTRHRVDGGQRTARQTTRPSPHGKAKPGGGTNSGTDVGLFSPARPSRAPPPTGHAAPHDPSATRQQPLQAPATPQARRARFLGRPTTGPASAAACRDPRLPCPPSMAISARTAARHGPDWPPTAGSAGPKPRRRRRRYAESAALHTLHRQPLLYRVRSCLHSRRSRHDSASHSRESHCPTTLPAHESCWAPTTPGKKCHPYARPLKPTRQCLAARPDASCWIPAPPGCCCVATCFVSRMSLSHTIIRPQARLLLLGGVWAVVWSGPRPPPLGAAQGALPSRVGRLASCRCPGRSR